MGLPRIVRQPGITASNGEIITRHVLPKGGYTYLHVYDRYQVIAAVQGGLITVAEVQERYHMSPREYAIHANTAPLPPISFPIGRGVHDLGGGLAIDYTNRTVAYNDMRLPISPQPFSLIELIVGYQGVVVTPEMVMTWLYPKGQPAKTKLIDVLLNRIRKTLFADNGLDNRILNCPRRGCYWQS